MEKRSNRAYWSEDDLCYLRECYRRGDAVSDIGDVLGVSSPTVMRKVAELGLKRPRGFNAVKRFHSRFVKCYSSRA